MGALRTIDVNTWPRREHFEHFMQASPCTWAITVQVDLTALADRLRESDRRTYVAQLWLLSTVVNRHEEFRMALDADGVPAVWDVVHPLFTVFNRDAETFSGVWAPYLPDFPAFHDGVTPLLAEYRTSTAYMPQTDVPANVFDVSSVPWMAFTSLELQIRDPWRYLAPIITIGRQFGRNGRTFMPLAIQVHHAVIDAFHVARLVEELAELAAVPDWLD